MTSENMVKDDVSRYLKLLHLKWSQEAGTYLPWQDMARRIGVPLGSLRRWMEAERPPDLQNTLKIATAARSPEILRITAPLYANGIDADALYIASVWGKLTTAEKDALIEKVKNLTEPLSIKPPSMSTE